MYCPKCATQNLDDAKFCRSCGADISLVPQVLTGQLAERLAAEESRAAGRPHRHRRREPTIENGVQKVFMGVAFLLVSMAVLFFSRGGQNWWFWMLIPSFIFMGGGVGTILRVRQDQKRLAPPPSVAPQSTFGQPPRQSALPPRDTGELIEPPPSVTEATTRHLGIPADRAPKDV